MLQSQHRILRLPALFMALLLALTGLLPAGAEMAVEGYVMTTFNGVSLRQTAQSTGEVLASLPNGTVLPVLDMEDGWYYVLYLEAGPGPTYTNCIARSRDLISWTYSPLNPVLMYDETEDKRIANPFLTEAEQRQIREAVDINNSDLELCEFNGRTIMYYSWGNQQGTEFLAEASWEGKLKDFLEAWFD